MYYKNRSKNFIILFMRSYNSGNVVCIFSSIPSVCGRSTICRHALCSECLTKKVHNDKIICPICSTEHNVLTGSLIKTEQDKRSPYIPSVYIGLSIEF